MYLRYEAEEAMNSHPVDAGKHPSRGLPGFFSQKYIYFPWECLKPTNLGFATFGLVAAEKRQGLQGALKERKIGKSANIRLMKLDEVGECCNRIRSGRKNSVRGTRLL